MEPTSPTPSPEGNDWEATHAAVPGPHAQHEPPYAVPAIELEPGWTAIRALLPISSDELLAVMLRPSFRPIKDLDLVPVAPCPYCLDGGLRMAGSIRTRHGREPVRACDTCAALEIGNGPASRHFPRRDTERTP
ncbi:MAG: hypothetical protein IVW57_16370 [Ktedonobacterales bacterium]|nr:hypothetical protein [Ktedonobacterales bacterium]